MNNALHCIYVLAFLCAVLPGHDWPDSRTDDCHALGEGVDRGEEATPSRWLPRERKKPSSLTQHNLNFMTQTLPVPSSRDLYLFI